MIIIVGDKKAVLKEGFSFEYVSENRLFLGRDGYTLSIAFPMKDCPENIDIFGHVNRADVTKPSARFECSIIDGVTSLFGTLSVVKVSDAEIECQFAEGRCAQTMENPFEDVIISDLDLGKPSITDPSKITPEEAWKSIDDGASEVALPWVNENYPTAPNNWVNYDESTYSYVWNPENRILSWQPYLIVITKRICAALGYTCDFTEWEQSPMLYLIVCNTLPGAREQPEYANAMPGWPVSEFFEKLELFLMCEFDFDHKAKTVSMHFTKNLLDRIAPVSIDNVVDSYNVEVSQDDSPNCDYIAAKRLAYKECSHSMWPYYSCDWYMAESKRIRRYDTLAELIDKNKRRDNVVQGITIGVHWGETEVEGWDPRFNTKDALLYAEDYDTYFVFRSIGRELFGTGESRNDYTQVYVLQPVNIFGSGMVEDDSITTEEIEFVPACIMDTYVSKDDDKGYMLFLNPSDSSDSSTGSDSDRPGNGGVGNGEPVTDSSTGISQPGPARTIIAGQKEKQSNCYDEIYVAFWDNFIVDPGKTPFPIVDGVIVTQDWSISRLPGHYIRLHGRYDYSEKPLISGLPKIDPKQKFKFSWVGSNIPNPRAVFFIKGKRYLCEKITATFTENGMSQLLKGEFYPLLDDQSEPS